MGNSNGHDVIDERTTSQNVISREPNYRNMRRDGGARNSVRRGNKCRVCKCPSNESDSRNMVYLQMMPANVKLLHIAVMRNDIKTVDKLLIEGVDVNFPWVSDPNSCAVKHGISPLHEAVALNHTAIAIKLINAGADLNEVDSKGMSPLCRACHFGNEKLVGTLVKAGAIVNLSRDFAKSPLWFAVLCLNQCKAGLLPEYASVIRILLDAGAEVRLPNAEGKSALHFVCSYMIAGIIPIFIDYGTYVDMTDFQFQTPLYDCIAHNSQVPFSKTVHRQRQYAVAEQLLKGGCDDLDLAVWIESQHDSDDSDDKDDKEYLNTDMRSSFPFLHQWCMNNVKRPLKLQNLCRHKLQRHFGGVYQTALCVHYLEIPSTLKQYICRKTFQGPN